MAELLDDAIRTADVVGACKRAGISLLELRRARGQDTAFDLAMLEVDEVVRLAAIAMVEAKAAGGDIRAITLLSKGIDKQLSPPQEGDVDSRAKEAKEREFAWAIRNYPKTFDPRRLRKAFGFEPGPEGHWYLDRLKAGSRWAIDGWISPRLAQVLRTGQTRDGQPWTLLEAAAVEAALIWARARLRENPDATPELVGNPHDQGPEDPCPFCGHHEPPRNMTGVGVVDLAALQKEGHEVEEGTPSEVITGASRCRQCGSNNLTITKIGHRCRDCGYFHDTTPKPPAETAEQG